MLASPYGDPSAVHTPAHPLAPLVPFRLSAGTNSLVGWQWEEGGVYPISRPPPASVRLLVRDTLEP